MAEETEGRVVQISATLKGQSRDGTTHTENSNDERVDDGEE